MQLRVNGFRHQPFGNGNFRRIELISFQENCRLNLTRFYNRNLFRFFPELLERVGPEVIFLKILNRLKRLFLGSLHHPITRRNLDGLLAFTGITFMKN